MHTQAINLVNRNPANMSVLLVVVNSVKIDLSSLVGEYLDLLLDLTEDDKFCEKALSILTSVLTKSISPEKKDIDMIKNSITKNFNEKIKIRLF